MDTISEGSLSNLSSLMISLFILAEFVREIPDRCRKRDENIQTSTFYKCCSYKPTSTLTNTCNHDTLRLFYRLSSFQFLRLDDSLAKQ
mmetsp:Transcript_521/g.868  ORF Transcript_521/g.868 Transcript_521/m.868 type:complete len:88 (-) Transcript_521:1493-1756(-)